MFNYILTKIIFKVKDKRNYEVNRLFKQNILLTMINVLNDSLGTLVLYLTVIIFKIENLE